MKIILDLDAHCIETEIRKQYNRTVDQLLRSGTSDGRDERKVEILKFLLENMCFPVIRSFCQRHQKEKENHAFIVDDAGQIEIFVNGKRVYKGQTAIDED